jgi:endonuclease YncB( thermonuclease family)
VNSILNQLLSRLAARARGTVLRRTGIAGVLAVVAVAVGFSFLDTPASARAETDAVFTLQGRVVSVADGDTFTILANGRTQRIRMASIDAPETGKGNQQPGQPYGQASRRALADLVAGKNLTLQCFERDRYERAICDVPLSQGGTANQSQVRNGMAWANMEKRGQFLRDKSMPDLQQQAQRQGRGLWADADPVEPWVWRYQCWRQKQC